MAQQAMDTFVAMMDDGSQRFVTKGEVFPDSHELVRRDADGSGLLFRRLDLGDEPPPKSEAKAEEKAAPVKAEAKPAAKAGPVKAAGGKP